MGSWIPQDTDPAQTEVCRAALRDPDFLRQTSPIHHLNLVTARVQIHQGESDTTTPPAWAEAIRQGLESAGKDVSYFSYAGQGHAFQDESWSLFMERVSDFFKATLTTE